MPAFELAYEEIVEADIPALTEVMTRAFDDDSQKHLGKEKGARKVMITATSSGNGCWGMRRVQAIK